MELNSDENPSNQVRNEPPAASQPRRHRATYARDKRQGGYLIRVQGPQANRFSGRLVPVTRMDNSESTEQLDLMLWSGRDDATGELVALYKFVAKPADLDDEIPF